MKSVFFNSTDVYLTGQQRNKSIWLWNSASKEVFVFGSTVYDPLTKRPKCYLSLKSNINHVIAET